MATAPAGPMRWALYALLLVFLIVLAVVSTTKTLGFAYRYSMPTLALRLDPDNAQALGALAQQQLTTATGPADRAAARRLAEKALRRDATVASAAGTLGLIADADGQQAKARRLIAYSDAVSRRDLATRLWLIEEAVNRGDVEGALKHYDVALRTANTATPLLFPVLLAAIEDPQLSGPIAVLLARQPEWAGSFLDQVTTRGDPAAAAGLFRALAARRAAPRPELVTALLQRLVEAERIGQAWSVYAALNPARARARLRDARFDAPAASPTVFDWQLADGVAVSASPTMTDAGPGLYVTGSINDNGAAAQQMVTLPPGRWRLRWRVSGEVVAPEAVRWEWRCAQDREAVASAPLAAGSLAVNVPPGCAGQWLTLAVDSREPAASFTLVGLTLSPG